MNIWMIAVAALAVLIVIVLVMAATRPNDFRIERSVRIGAPPERIFAMVNDLAEWKHWSPWEKKDPAMAREFSASTVGLGATYAWRGNREVGEGRMTVIESQAPVRFRLRMEFLAPFKATHEAAFELKSEGSATHVSWAMTGRHPFIGKIMCLFFNMDRMVGRDFEAGLAALRERAEQPA